VPQVPDASRSSTLPATAATERGLGAGGVASTGSASTSSASTSPASAARAAPFRGCLRDWAGTRRQRSEDDAQRHRTGRRSLAALPPRRRRRRCNTLDPGRGVIENMHSTYVESPVERAFSPLQKNEVLHLRSCLYLTPPPPPRVCMIVQPEDTKSCFGLRTKPCAVLNDSSARSPRGWSPEWCGKPPASTTTGRGRRSVSRGDEENPPKTCQTAAVGWCRLTPG